MQRINARLDEERSKKLEVLKSLLHSSTTEVVLQAIDELYQKQLGDNKNRLNALLNSDFVACSSAEYDLSSNHKTYLSTALDKKYDNR